MLPDYRLNLTIMKETFSVYRLKPGALIPDWAAEGPFTTITRTPAETSIITLQGKAPGGTTEESDWRCIEVEGPLPFTLIGLLASILVPLAQAEISIMAVSTFDTDYVLVKDRNLEAAVYTMMQAGHHISRLGD